MRRVAVIVCLVSLACASSRPRAPEAEPGAEAPVLPPAGFEWADPARDVLVQYCGSCHRSDLATSVPGALAVFDLTEDPWFGRLRKDQFEGLIQRIDGTRAATDADKTVIEDFVRRVRDAETFPRTAP